MPSEAACRAATIFAIVLLAPGASALPGTPQPASILYDVQGGPIALTLGLAHAEAAVNASVFALNVTVATFTDVPRLRIDSVEDGQPRQVVFENVDVEVHGGGFAWTPSSVPLRLSGAANYGAGVVMPPEPGSPNGTIFVMASPDAAFTVTQAPDGRSSILLSNAIVTIRDHATGAAVAGWDKAAVNTGGRPGAHTSPSRPDAALLRMEGPFSSRVVASVTGAMLGRDEGEVVISIAPAPQRRFNETVAAFSQLAGGPGSPLAPGVFDALAPIEAILNGALLLVHPEGAQGDWAPIYGEFGDQRRVLGSFTYVRARDLTLAVGPSGTALVTGEAYLSYTQNEFSTAKVADAFPGLPLVSVFLWAGALAALVAWLVKRPAKSVKGPRIIRLSVLGVHAIILIVVFLVYDQSFGDAFGTSLVSAVGSTPFRWSGLMVAAVLQLVPWSLGLLLFAVPTRIAVGILLRYLGKGATYKGVAKSVGLVVFGLLIPSYVLYLLNETVFRFVPSSFAP